MAHTDILLAIAASVSLIASGGLGTIETATRSISRARVEELAKEERGGAAALLRVLDKRAEHINLLVLLRTFLDSAAAVFVAGLCFSLLGPTSSAGILAIVALTLVTYVVVGVFSRTVGKQNPYTVSLKTAMVLSALSYVLGPISTLLIRLGNMLAPGPGFKEGPFATEVELKEMVDIAQERGIVENEERRMIHNVFDLATTIARSVMVPRPEMIWIESGKTAGQATTLCVRSGHSRIPVIGDNVDDIVGVVYLKDLVQKSYYDTDGGRSRTVDDIMRPATFVPDSKPLDSLLQEMQLNRNHIAMLVDEYGGIAGLVSIEDILEEIVGEIADEYDIAETAPTEKLDERTYRVQARLTLEDLTEMLYEDLGIDIDWPEDITDQVDTVGGLIAVKLGRVPLPGTQVEAMGITFRSEGSRDRRGRLRVNSVVVTVADDATLAAAAAAEH